MGSSRIILIVTLALTVSALVAISIASCRNGNGAGGAGSGSASGTSATTGNAKETERIVIGGRAFDLEVVADPESRAQGLMHRESIDEHGGMLFIFPDNEVKVQSFWMKNCLVDIDIIYLDPHGRVTATHRMKAQPPQGPEEPEAAYEARVQQQRYPSGYPAQFAIELRSGWLDQLNLKVEDRIDLDVARLKALAR
jgi:uncharacterized membrane protein (UPF0127 family)